MHHPENSKYWSSPMYLAHWKSYEHGFMKNHKGHKLCAKLRFNRFFVHHIRNSKYWSFLMYQPMGSHIGMVS
ncbi:hypothetical protein BHE74_00024542 [Ensete ventricosum]|nr:hypothetical protein GW17_00032775 [Ensete ventricosum]RWW67969.1 hypothetical protein BHE74_00024542 [Ensete ventricosum]RZS09065.1 hypothetical protein BHM03_00040105 [Ensete ventricosum]